MLIEIPNDIPIMRLIEFATDNGYQVRWKPDGKIKATLIPLNQPQPAEAATEAGQ